MSRSLLLVVFVALPLLLLWGAVLVDLISRSDLSILARVAWAAATFLTEHVAVLAYLIARPLRYPEDRASAHPGVENLIAAVTGREQGTVDESGVQSVKARVLAAS